MPRVPPRLPTRLPTPTIGQFSIALLLVAGVWSMCALLDPLLGERAPFLLFTIPILVCALFVGRESALVAALLSIAAGVSIIARDGSLDLGDAVSVGAFAVVGGGIIWLAEPAARGTGEPSAKADGHLDKAAQAADELRALIDSVAEYAIFMLDPDGRITVWSGGAERVLGWSETDVIGRNHSLFYPQQEQLAGKPSADLDAASGQRAAVEQAWRCRRNGSEFLAEVTSTALREHDGRIRGFAQLLRDVTGQRAEELAIERRERFLRVILESTPVAMVVSDEAGAIIWSSAAAHRQFGYEGEDMTGRSVRMLMSHSDPEAQIGSSEQNLETGQVGVDGIARAATGLRKDGLCFPMELVVGEAIGEDGRMLTWTFHDIAARNGAEGHVQASVGTR